MSDSGFMTSTYFSFEPQMAPQAASTPSFGTHQISDRPASAPRKGARVSKARRTPVEAHQYGAPARSIGDIASAPFRWGVATKPRKIALAGVIMMVFFTLIF
jgi:hypothetical protein